jgi:hypothetical protein
MRQLLQEVVVIGAVKMGESQERSAWDEFPKVFLQN